MLCPNLWDGCIGVVAAGVLSKPVRHWGGLLETKVEQ